MDILKVPYKFELVIPGSRKSPRGSQSPEFRKLSPAGLV
jgi:hypothetical protein